MNYFNKNTIKADISTGNYINNYVLSKLVALLAGVLELSILIPCSLAVGHLSSKVK